ncbi:MAG: beta-ketoacyl-ACP reductase [Chloroflexi bacterium RBG_19FT_COMBO_47_15]|nr:MAG: beta-ketoacyl-ACP reductase [Chloroflexi bacterium RBG_19FT_COMBO_47_15]
MRDFEGQTVIVTGGTRGIGKAIAESFLKAGAKVVVTYSTNEGAAARFKQDNSQFAENIDVQKLDVGKYEEVERFFKYIDTKHGNFEVLVNNAGIRKDSVLAMMKESDWHDVLNVNLTGVFYMCKFAVRNLMRKRYGRIINISSVMERYAFDGQANYAAAKAGLSALTKSLSKEVATRGITVNCVSPGFIETELIQDLPDKLREAYLDRIPAKRFGCPEDVAVCVLFLASKEASYVTGSTLEVSGGL